MLNIITIFLILTEVTEIHEVIEMQKFKLNRRTNQQIIINRKEVETETKHKTAPK